MIKQLVCAFLGHPPPSLSMERYAAKLLAEHRMKTPPGETWEFQMSCWCGKIWWPIEPDWEGK